MSLSPHHQPCLRQDYRNLQPESHLSAAEAIQADEDYDSQTDQGPPGTRSEALPLSTTRPLNASSVNGGS